MTTFRGLTTTIVEHGDEASVICITRCDGPLMKAPAQDVWSVLINYEISELRRWNTTTVESEFVGDGPKKDGMLEVGDVVRLIKESDGVRQAPGYFRVVRMVAPYHVVFLTIPDPNAEPDPSQGLYYIDHSVLEFGDMTQDIYTNYREIRVPADQAAAVAQAEQEAEDGLRAYLIKGLEMIKEVAESNVAASRR